MKQRNRKVCMAGMWVLVISFLSVHTESFACQLAPIAAPVAEANAKPDSQTKSKTIVKAPLKKAAAKEVAEGVEGAAGSADSKVIHWLEQIEAKSKTVKSLHSGIKLEIIDDLLSDKQRHFGSLVFDGGTPTKFGIHFKLLQVYEGKGKWKTFGKDRRYIFDGTWLIEKHGDTKQFWKYQMREPGAKPGAVDPLALGKGPFPIPLKPTKAALLKMFTIRLVEPVIANDDDDDDDQAHPKADGHLADLPDTVHLRLIPKARSKMKYDQLDLWYHTKMLLPVRAKTYVKDADKAQIVNLTKIVLNKKIDPADLDTKTPGRGWRVEIQRWRGDESSSKPKP